MKVQIVNSKNDEPASIVITGFDIYKNLISEEIIQKN